MPLPDHEKWRIEMVKELIEVKWGKLAIDKFDEAEINKIIMSYVQHNGILSLYLFSYLNSPLLDKVCNKTIYMLKKKNTN